MFAVIHGKEVQIPDTVSEWLGREVGGPPQLSRTVGGHHPRVTVQQAVEVAVQASIERLHVDRFEHAVVKRKRPYALDIQAGGCPNRDRLTHFRGQPP